MNAWVLSVACLTLLVTTQSRAGQPLTTQLVASGFTKPVMVKSPPGDFQRVFVVERDGKVRLIKNGVLQATAFLDLTGQVQTYDERGLLDIAFHPNYPANGYCYVRYTDLGSPHGRTRIKRFTRSGNPDIADAGSGYSIMQLPSTSGFHIGGTIDFGRDGFLYVTAGDGSDMGNAQEILSLHGKILRVDVNSDALPGNPDNNYAIPPGNPYAGPTPGADEIWAKGFRNPYRAAFDRITGGMWVADVGHTGEFATEEIDILPLNVAGLNLGWPCMEGSVCWPSNCSCTQPGLVAPVFEYLHLGHCAVIGGRMYRGCAIPDLSGTYFFADFCSSNIWSFRYDNGQMTEFNSNRDPELDPPGSPSISSISGFGEDAYGEIYICDMNGGEVFKIVPVTSQPDSNFNGVPDTCEPDVGDIDHNGIVNVLDLLAVINSWGPCFECPTDVAPHPTGDGTVNVLDLLLVINNWG